MSKFEKVTEDTKAFVFQTKEIANKHRIKAKQRIKNYFKKLFKILKRNEMSILPGQLAFSLVLSFFPLLSIVGVICSFFSLSLSDMLDFMMGVLPTDVFNLLKGSLEAQISGVNILYILLGIFLASNGLRSVISSCNTLYNLKNKNDAFRWIKAVFLTIILMFFIMTVLIILAFGDTIFKFIMGLFEENIITQKIYFVFKLGKWPIAIFIIYNLVKIIYILAPDRKVTNKFARRGAIFTTIGWVLVTGVYSFYANNIANYNLFYGNISNIIILMTWVYIISYIFVIGIGINANDYLEEINSDN